MTTVKVGVIVDDGGTTSKLTAGADKLKSSLEGAAKAAKAVRVPSAVAAAQQGVSATNALSMPTVAKPSQVSGQGESKTARSVGAGAGTGSATSDFAAQAQGLGGLVHVYATFAANLFAVSAAFTALSKAADTTNLVKGLDQMGATSGKALGSLAKQLVTVTDGALSLRDAMTSTAMASSSGMTNQAIVRMTEVARKASMALGRDMPDSMERLTKGIVKIQPELLDELGIMTRVIPAQQDYARELGKSASALTDFEKRQAFANAVLSEGERKFSAIKLDSNPYSKILASTQDLLQVGLELTNKVLSPLVGILATSPVALAVAIGGLATVLLKQAVPAIGMFREQAKRMEVETLERVKKQVSEQQWAGVRLDQIASENAERQYRIQVAADGKLKDLSGKRFNKAIVGQEVRGLLSTSPFDLSKEEIEKIKSKQEELATAAKDSAKKIQADKMKLQLDAFAQLKKNMLEEGHLAAELNQKGSEDFRSHENQKQRYLENLRNKAAKSSTVSLAADNAATMGPGFAYTKLKADLADLKASGMSTLGTQIKGTFAIATSAIGTFMNAFSGVMMGIGLAAAAFGALSSWLSTNSKESEKLAASTTALDDAFANMSRTLDAIVAKDPLTAFSVENIQARANALQNLSDSLSGVVKDFDKLRGASSWWDKGMDALWDAVGKGAADKISTNISTAIASGLSGLEKGPLKDSAVAKLQQILGKKIDVTNLKLVNDELRKLNNTEIITAGTAIDKVLKEVALSSSNTAATLTSTVNSLNELGKLVQTQKNALIPTDPVGKLGAQMLSSASELSNALKDPINSILILNKIAGDSNQLSLLSPDTGSLLLSTKKELDALTDSYSILQKQTLDEETKLQRLKDSGKATKPDDTKTGVAIVDTEEATKIKEALSNLNAATEASKAKIAAATSQIAAKVASDFVNVGLKNLASSLTAAVAEGGITAAKGYLSVLKEAGMQTAGTEGKLKSEELGSQRALLEATYAQIRQQQQNTNATELNNIGLAILANELALSTAGTSETRRAKALEERPNLDKRLEEAIQKADLTNKSPQDAAKVRGGGQYSDKVLSEMSGYLASMTGYLSGIAKINGQAAANTITTFANTKKEETVAAQAANNRAIQKDDSQLSTINALLAASSAYDEINEKKKTALELDKLQLTYTNKALDTRKNLMILEEAGKFTGKDAKYIAAEKAVKDQDAENERSRIAEKKAIEITALDRRLKGISLIDQKLRDSYTLERNDIAAIASANLASDDSRVKYLEQIGAMTVENSTRLQGDIALKQQNLEYDKQSNELYNAYITKYNQIQDDKARAEKAGSGTGDLQLQQDNLVNSYFRQAEAQRIVNATKVDSISLATTQGILVAKQNEDMAKMVSITEGLTSAFGTLGESIGKAGEAILKMGQVEQNNLKAKQALETTRDDPKTDASIRAASISALAKLEKKAEQDKMAGIASTAGATKKMFAEHTTAYKALTAVEKAASAMKVALQLKELAIEWGIVTAKTASGEAGMAAIFAEAGAYMATLPAKISSSVASIWSGAGSPYLAIGLTAGFLALMSSLGAESGSVNMSGMTAADRQETQGTGQSWVDGTKTDTGGGVFGDNSTKNSAILDSLKILQVTGVEGLDYNKRMLKAMERIANSVTDVATSIYQIPGVRVGSGFGTTEGTSGGSFLGWGSSTSTSIKDAGVSIKGTFADLLDTSKNVVKQYETILTETSSSSWFGLSKSSSSSVSTNEKTLSDPKLTQAFADIFLNATSMFIEVGKSASITEASIRQTLAGIPISLTTSLKGLTGPQMEAELNATVGKALSTASEALFAGMFEKFNKFGEDYLTTVIRVIDGSDKVGQALTSMGSSLVDNVSKFDISQELIKNAGGLQNFMDQTSAFKDNFLTAAEKLAPVQKSVNAQLTKLGISTSITRDEFKALVLAQDLSVESGRSMYQSLMELQAGFNTATTGIDSAVGSSLDLQIALLQAQGKLDAATQLSRAKALKGMSAEDAAIQRQIDLQLDANKTRGLENTLLTAQGKASVVLQRTRSLELLGLSAIDAELQRRIYLLADEAAIMNQEASIYTALGKSAEALVITRGKELDAMVDSLKPRQIYLYALQDEATLKGKLTTAYNSQANAIKATITSLTSSIKTLKDYRNALSAGASSVLTPSEKYAQAKSNLYQTSAAAQATITSDSTTAEIAARDAAISQLSSTSDTFLAMSKEMYASSGQYTTDYASVLSLIDSTSGILASQQTDAEKQLAALDSSVGFLNIIATNTDTVASLLSQYLGLQGATDIARTGAISAGSVAATTALPGFATGGLASGLAMVGENGPEVIDFRTPTRVYSNRASNDLLSNADLINEIKALRQEVSQLRADQKEQTGHIISTNYDANNRNATVVSDATAQAARQQEWKQRSKVAVV